MVNLPFRYSTRKTFVQFLHLKHKSGSDEQSALINMGILYRQLGNGEMSRDYLIQALQGLLKTGQIEGGRFSLAPIALEVLGLLAADGQEMRHAAVLLGVAEAQREVLNAGLTEDERNTLTQDMAPIRAALQDSEFATAWAEGRALTLQQALIYAMGFPT
ncbi:hypothetical protein ACFP9V_17255 [Deinococcus radiopugnans]|uniref:Uncharacterized protein n=1 Tax=Deinococcus radiopugnans ATCC 19172 TaxID=585398 RepID=A0A5C4Y618_9DEIO|nr:hypothetical protein [Deinococcus radiopugnans]MBB6016758.1 hypothetical protein [Deinococcus radiopugnans ATCC 19172]TNM70861.1 hypothetical protein FHR04_11920 [Deinococcus radiopugnans ATCC 19172]